MAPKMRSRYGQARPGRDLPRDGFSGSSGFFDHVLDGWPKIRVRRGDHGDIKRAIDSHRNDVYCKSYVNALLLGRTVWPIAWISQRSRPHDYPPPFPSSTLPHVRTVGARIFRRVRSTSVYANLTENPVAVLLPRRQLAAYHLAQSLWIELAERMRAGASEEGVTRTLIHALSVNEEDKSLRHAASLREKPRQFTSKEADAGEHYLLSIGVEVDAVNPPLPA